MDIENDGSPVGPSTIYNMVAPLMPYILDRTFEHARQVLPAESFRRQTAGGYISIHREVGDTFDLQHIATWPVGHVPDRSESWKTVIEKVNRLHQYVSHITSWRSRDEEQARFGGAVRTPSRIILSFSGLPEYADEALVCHLALHLKLVDPMWALKVQVVSNNPMNFETLWAPIS